MKTEMESVTEWLFDLTRFGSKNGLDNTRELLSRLGNPQDDFRTIHVAGSDGKGSTCAFIESVLRCAGIRTGLFTSPHILRPNERSGNGHTYHRDTTNDVNGIVALLTEDITASYKEWEIHFFSRSSMCST